MGHLAGKDVYLRAARRLDSLEVRTPYNEALRALLAELYTPAEADLIARMSSTPCTRGRLLRDTGLEGAELGRLLEALCEKGLVVDLYDAARRESLYRLSPFVVGVFELTMMRTASDDDHRRRARLFREYWPDFLQANCGSGRLTSVLRTLPHEAALSTGDHVEVMDHERASHLVAEAQVFSAGVCSCRHEKHHLGERSCTTALESCTAMGAAASYLIRRRLAREISRSEMLERIERSRELGLVLTADNVRHQVAYLCHCCACCCNLLQAVTRFGYPNALVTSSLTAKVNEDACIECGDCVRACPLQIIAWTAEAPEAVGQASRMPAVDQEACIGCGVCATRCATGGISLVSRATQVYHPENLMHRVILQALEAGTLQHLLFENPNSHSQGFLRALVGGFLRLPPVKRALVSERLRSVFLDALTAAADRRGTGTALLASAAGSPP